MMGIARSSVVCFVIDTTGSMFDDIAEARKIVFDIIDRKKGTQDEPSEYILVPFNDPSMKFSLLREFKQYIFHCWIFYVVLDLSGGKVIFSRRLIFFLPSM